MEFLGMITEDFLDGCAHVGVQEDLDFRSYAKEDGLGYLIDDTDYGFDGLGFDAYDEDYGDEEEWGW